MKGRDLFRACLEDSNVRAFLAVIDLGEHGPNADDPDRYRTMFGGGLFDAPPWEHPNRKNRAAGLVSTAAGRGQFLAGTWADLVKAYGFPDFSPPCQDEAMVALIARRDALDDVIEGRFEAAIEKCAREWASLPGSPYGQPVLDIDAAARRYIERGGQFSGERKPAESFNPDSLETEHYGEAVTESTVQPEEAPTMAPIVLPLLQIAAQFIPQLAEKFSSGSETAKRNIAAGKVLAEAITTATNSPNLQAAVEKMQADPGAVKAAKAAVAQQWPELFEVGDGGIASARKAAEAYVTAEWWRALAVPQTWIALLLLGLVYIAMGNVTGLFGFQGWTPELRSNVVFAIVGVAIGSVSGYYFGTSQGSQRKTDIIANKE